MARKQTGRNSKKAKRLKAKSQNVRAEVARWLAKKREKSFERSGIDDLLDRFGDGIASLISNGRMTLTKNEQGRTVLRFEDPKIYGVEN